VHSAFLSLGKSLIFARHQLKKLLGNRKYPTKYQTNMKKILALSFVAAICMSIGAYAQPKADTTRKRSKATWKKNFNIALYAGQAGSKNWASGSEPFSLSGNAFLNGFMNRESGRWYWNNNFIASFGMVNNKNQGFRKNDDKLDYYSTIGRKFRKKPTLALAGAFNFRSQFWKGYDHDYLNQGIKRRTSGFFAPAYITLAPGVEFTPAKGKTDLKVFLGFGFRGVIVSNAPYSYAFQGGQIPSSLVNEKNVETQETSVAAMYGVDPNRTIRYEYGPYLAATYNREVFKNVTWMGRVDLFADANSRADKIDVFFTNTFSLKVNNWLSAIYAIDLAYDDHVQKFGYYKNRPGTQVKSVLGVGINARLK
jgi:hypothetical protein